MHVCANSSSDLAKGSAARALALIAESNTAASSSISQTDGAIASLIRVCTTSTGKTIWAGGFSTLTSHPKSKAVGSLKLSQYPFPTLQMRPVAYQIETTSASCSTQMIIKLPCVQQSAHPDTLSITSHHAWLSDHIRNLKKIPPPLTFFLILYQTFMCVFSLTMLYSGAWALSKLVHDDPSISASLELSLKWTVSSTSPNQSSTIRTAPPAENMPPRSDRLSDKPPRSASASWRAADKVKADREAAAAEKEKSMLARADAAKANILVRQSPSPPQGDAVSKNRTAAVAAAEKREKSMLARIEAEKGVTKRAEQSPRKGAGQKSMSELRAEQTAEEEKAALKKARSLARSPSKERSPSAQAPLAAVKPVPKEQDVDTVLTPRHKQLKKSSKDAYQLFEQVHSVRTYLFCELSFLAGRHER